MADVAVVGLAVMGANLALNMADHGFTVAVYNRTVSKVDELVGGAGRGKRLVGVRSVEELAHSLKRPRRLLIMVRAGDPVDDFIAQMLPLLEAGDILMDGGNSNFRDTIRRVQHCEAKGILFVGVGVSGGEEGARHGPSIMPGGSAGAWEHVKPIFQAIAAKAGEEPCCDWVGPEGAGHYVKMVHNGIEYADMQLISECFHLLSAAGFSLPEIGAIFDDWNAGELNCYLLEITAEILRKRDEDGELLVTKILDVAGQKGTGKWTVSEALECGAPATVIGEAVFARFLSSLRADRRAASRVLPGPAHAPQVHERAPFVEAVRQALYAAKIVCYAQGFMMMREAAAQYKWPLNYGGIALMWRGGCIIRSRFLGDIKTAFVRSPNLQSLLLDDFFAGILKRAHDSLRRTVVHAVQSGVPAPALSSALAFYDGYRHERLPAFLLQAQRDYFGAHTYERTDRSGVFHTDWTGRGGSTTSSTYNA